MSVCSFLAPSPPSFEAAIAQHSEHKLCTNTTNDEAKTEEDETADSDNTQPKEENNSNDDTHESSMSSNDSSLLDKTTVDGNISFENDAGNLSEDDVFTVANFNC